MTAEEFWSDFLRTTHRDESIRFLECFQFDLQKEAADRLLELVLMGKKKATASSLFYYERENIKIPEPGDFSVVADGGGNPRCVIETAAVTIIPFREITYEICKREGEDDNLESWRRNHRKFFMAEGQNVGYQFTEDMPVVFEDFNVVYAG